MINMAQCAMKGVAHSRVLRENRGFVAGAFQCANNLALDLKGQATHSETKIKNI